jgi:hypothetical protein
MLRLLWFLIVLAETAAGLGVRRPVRQACQEQTNPDASLTIRTKTDGDPDWKKALYALSRRSIGTQGEKTASPDEADH